MNVKRLLHPILVDFPIVFLTSAFLADLLFWRTASAQWADFSFWLILAGWLSGLLAVATGLLDFLSSGQARSLTIGWLHFLLADIAIFISTFNLILRLPDHQGSVLFTGLVYSSVVAVLLVIASNLGGRLVFRHMIGVYGLEQEKAGEKKAQE